ncbi:hypothetical protein G4O51_04055 [Candidatus Bathyarchaeota archaeon A05DMB-2]|nr:hypothetical protein [Candidatus Bathyarchaeota archaeon A05DMB-2]
MVVSNIFKVIYAPQKAFKNILQNPQYLGAFILLIIFVALQVSYTYVAGSNQYLEKNNPSASQGDFWAQNAGLWQASPGVTIRNNTVDYINSTATFFGGPPYFGTNSIEFVAFNVSNVRIELKDLNGTVNCGPDGFRNVSLIIKIVTPDVKPSNVSLYLDSLNNSSFHYDLTSLFSSSAANVWNNITIPVNTSAWSSSNPASWENITSIRMSFMWPSGSDVDMRIGGLFFGGLYQNYVQLYGGPNTFLAQAALSGIAPFIFEWIILTAIMYVLIKMLKGNITWRPLMVAVGFAMITLVIQAIIFLAVYATLPVLYLPIQVLANVSGGLNLLPAATIDAINTANLITNVVLIIMYLWTVGLGAIITREITAPQVVAAQQPVIIEGSPVTPQFSWVKSILVSSASFLVTLLIVGFLLG